MQSCMHNWTISSSTTWPQQDWTFVATQDYIMMFRCAERSEVSLRGERAQWRGRWEPGIPGVEPGQARKLPSQQHVRTFISKSIRNFLKFRIHPLIKICNEINFRRLNPDKACQRKKDFFFFVKFLKLI